MCELRRNRTIFGSVDVTVVLSPSMTRSEYAFGA
jgi:hypothetical protein